MFIDFKRTGPPKAFYDDDYIQVMLISQGLKEICNFRLNLIRLFTKPSNSY